MPFITVCDNRGQVLIPEMERSQRNIDIELKRNGAKLQAKGIYKTDAGVIYKISENISKEATKPVTGRGGGL